MDRLTRVFFIMVPSLSHWHEKVVRAVGEPSPPDPRASGLEDIGIRRVNLMSMDAFDDDPRAEDALEEIVHHEDTDVEEIVRGRDDDRAERDPDERTVDLDEDR